MHSLDSLIKDKISVRCPQCRRTLCWIGKETLGVAQFKCFHNDCLKITDFLFYSEKVYVFSKKLQKRKDILNSLPKGLKEIIIDAVIQ